MSSICRNYDRHYYSLIHYVIEAKWAAKYRRNRATHFMIEQKAYEMQLWYYFNISLKFPVEKPHFIIVCVVIWLVHPLAVKCYVTIFCCCSRPLWSSALGHCLFRQLRHFWFIVLASATSHAPPTLQQETNRYFFSLVDNARRALLTFTLLKYVRHQWSSGTILLVDNVKTSP